MIRLILGFLGIVLGIGVGVYVGVWLCFVGGILGLITAGTAFVATGTLGTALIAFSILKIVVAGIAGWLSAIVIIFPSYALMISSN